jgi:hypothetical protein
MTYFPLNLAIVAAMVVPVLTVRRHPQTFRTQKLTAISTVRREVYTVSKSSELIGTAASSNGFPEWSNKTLPDPIRDPSACGKEIGSHICDPQSCLSWGVLHAQDLTLQRFETQMKSAYCPDKGYRVYMGIMHNIGGKGGLRKVANDLGHKWGILGTPCSNGIVALYSTQNSGNVAIEVDEKLKERMFPATVVDHLERTPLGVLELRSPDDVVMSLVSELDLVLDGSMNSHVWFDNRTLMFFYAPFEILGLIFSFVMLCCVYDTIAHWRHRAHFRSCANKLEQVHEVFLSADAELPLCPICVNSVSHTNPTRAVVFLCGHRFHTDCANRYFRHHKGMSGRCPICELPHSYSCEHPGDHSLLCESKSLASSPVNSVDEVKSFFLSSLRHQYPDIIPESSVERWSSCHTEIWLSELKCPQYQTLFDKSPFGEKAEPEISSQLSETAFKQTV